MESREFFDDKFKTWQVPVIQVETLTGISFGLPKDADPMGPGSSRKGSGKPEELSLEDSLCCGHNALI
ncbi:hypothetical protein MSBRW_1760 [Methanosarcina barkeri str. Wiesmoor]|uniref:Uncharacterized protein n=1 Tax=Methanosarcina barkeri str. Wiesmoor TaxID=1434109 RepID=A0A0E3QLB9_METBA|nr:hypothetical protein MSBRW_1760 [Methanosarcina barkeri str. Wiesmoor]